MRQLFNILESGLAVVGLLFVFLLLKDLYWVWRFKRGDGDW